MAIYQGAASVGTTATQLNQPRNMPGIVHISNLDNTDVIYVGGAGVTTATGHGIQKSAEIDIQLFADQTLYAISTKAGHSVTWLHVTP